MQLLDLSFSKPFKSVLREYWEDHLVKVLKDARDEANNNPSFKLSSSTRRDIVKWFIKNLLSYESTAMIQISFDTTATNPGLVHNGDVLKRIMANVEVDSDQTDDDKF